MTVANIMFNLLKKIMNDHIFVCREPLFSPLEDPTIVLIEGVIRNKKLLGEKRSKDII